MPVTHHDPPTVQVGGTPGSMTVAVELFEPNPAPTGVVVSWDTTDPSGPTTTIPAGSEAATHTYPAPGEYIIGFAYGDGPQADTYPLTVPLL